MILSASPTENWEILQAKLPVALMETLGMVGVSGLAAALLGIPLGLVLAMTEPGGIRPRPLVNKTLSFIVNIGRSTPFIILMIALIPLTRLIAGTSLGWKAACVPLSIGAIPFIARLVQNALRSVPTGKIEAARMAGANTWQAATGVLLREAIPGILASLTLTAVTLVSYSAMAGTVGGGGLGTLAYYYGYQRFMPDIMIATVVLTIIVVQLLQLSGDRIVRRVQRRYFGTSSTLD